MRSLDRYIIDLIIILESVVLLVTIFFSSKEAMPFLIVAVALSYTLMIFILQDILYQRTNKKSLLFLVFSILSIISYHLLFNTEPNKIIIFISGLILLVYFNYRGIDKKNFGILILMSCIMIGSILLQSNKWDNFDEKDYFRIAWENANMAGIAITSVLLPIFIGAIYAKEKLFKVILLIVFSGGLFSLALTFNRSSIFSLILLFLLYLYNRKEYRLPEIIRKLIVLSPIIILLIFINYIIFYGDILLFGKSIAQRPGWPILFAQFINSPLSLHNLESGGLNFFIASTIEYGLIGTVLIIFLYISVKPSDNQFKNIKYRYVAYLAFISLFVQQSFENTFVDGAFGIYIYSYMLLGIANLKD
jgi:hypothetical protein